MKGYVAIECACRHCGGRLKAYRFSDSVAVEYRHAATDKHGCPPRTYAAPCDDKVATSAYRKAVRVLGNTGEPQPAVAIVEQAEDLWDGHIDENSP